MIDAWERMLSRPFLHKALLWLGTLCVLSMLSWNFFIADTYGSLDDASRKADSLESQVNIETTRLRNLPALRKELERYQALYGRALEMLPRKGQVESLLESVSELARDAGLTVKSFTPRAELKRQFFSEIPVDVEMKGNFHQIEIFLDELSRISRIVNIQDILIDNPRGAKDGGLVEVDVRTVLKTFRYLEESERPVTDSKQSGELKK
jgi:type IV pilus assembly protein PilO